MDINDFYKCIIDFLLNMNSYNLKILMINKILFEIN